ncbi:MAG: nicotinate-nucleotide adenylyltransferase [Candidatus Omnitrophica bacterium]|nr:nicotinate-nucleotide adenylyltransferase [Candidatus Omnitrophota bacterium]
MAKSVHETESGKKFKIGILGGTFDPIHLGHLSLARHAQKQFHLDKILFIPAFIPPHKASRRDLTPAPYRYRMVELAIQKEPGFEISDLELNRPDISYTVDTLRDLEKKYPRSEFYLIVGSDTLAEIPGWHEGEEIMKKIHFLAARREAGKKIDIPPDKIAWIDMPVCEISSSTIRSCLEKGQQTSQWLPPSVEAYILENKLYRTHS